MIQSLLMREEKISIRPATVEDGPALVRLRRLMFESMGCTDQAQMDAMDVACSAYFARAMSAGRYHGWLAVTGEGEAIASGGVVVDEHPPGPYNLSGQVGYIMNMSTDPAYRRQGVARQLMHQIMAWIRSQGIEVASLHRSEMGRSLYTEFGFQDSNEMRTRV